MHPSHKLVVDTIISLVDRFCMYTDSKEQAQLIVMISKVIERHNLNSKRRSPNLEVVKDD